MITKRVLKRLIASASILIYVCSASKVEAQYWEKGYALFTNDRVMSGRIEQQAQQYKIKLNEGNEIRVPKTQVAVIGNSMQDLYQYKKSALPPYPRTGDHIKLARWCLTTDMLAEAGEHYLLLAHVAPPAENPSIKQLGLEIRNKMLQQNDFRVAVGMSPINAGPTASSNAAAAPTRLPGVVTASGTTAWSGVLPTRAHLKFAEQIQHILINRCGQAACHGNSTTTNFRLLEIGGADTPVRTQTNLESVLKYISEDPQAKSALIDYMNRTHGTMASPAIGNRDAKLSLEVMSWVQMIQNPVVSAEALNQPNVLNPLAPGAPQLRQVPHGSTPPNNGGLNSISPSLPDFPQGLDLPTQAELDALDAQVGRNSNAPSQIHAAPATNNSLPFVMPSSDPFDPAEFNRQAGARRQ